MIDVNIRMGIDIVLQTVSSIDFYNRYGEKYGSSESIINQMELLKDTIKNLKTIDGYDENDIRRFEMLHQHLTWLFEGIRDKRSDDN